MLQITDVHKSFTDRKRRTSQHVLRGVDLTVEPGEFVCLIGHPGCGKSTPHRRAQQQLLSLLEIPAA